MRFNKQISTCANDQGRMGGLTAPCMLVISSLLLSGCVTSTLGSVDTQPEPQPVAENTRYDPEARAQAVAEIREKANYESAGLSNAFADGDGPNETMEPSHQQQLIEQLEQDAAQNQAAVKDEELNAFQRSIREMQRKAKSHYDNALNSIKN